MEVVNIAPGGYAPVTWTPPFAPSALRAPLAHPIEARCACEQCPTLRRPARNARLRGRAYWPALQKSSTPGMLNVPTFLQASLQLHPQPNLIRNVQLASHSNHTNFHHFRNDGCYDDMSLQEHNQKHVLSTSTSARRQQDQPKNANHAQRQIGSDLSTNRQFQHREKALLM